MYPAQTDADADSCTAVSQRSDRNHTRRSFRAHGSMSNQSQQQSRVRGARPEDSWVEISSQPSSTSLASLEHREEIITTGLHVRHNGGSRSRSRPLRIPPRQITMPTAPPRSASIGGSSQDEYEESESDSESDRVMSSSNEEISSHDANRNLGLTMEERAFDQLQQPLLRPDAQFDQNVFTPQPNAFSHRPAVLTAASTANSSSNTAVPGSYFPAVVPTTRPESTRLPSNRLPSISRPSTSQSHARQSSSHVHHVHHVQPDHDAALRASLTTLLSCAAAVGKDREPTQPTHRASTNLNANHPTTLRLVPESELNGTTVGGGVISSASPPRQIKSASKRRSRESSKERERERQAKKVRAVKAAGVSPAATEELVSPTMMTWFISAGMVLVFSALSFSAGYAWGKEAGRVEGQMSLDGSCGREALRSGGRSGLSKLRLASTRT